MAFEINFKMKGAAAWFKENSEQVFDALDVPNDDKIGEPLRKESAARIASHLMGEKWEGERFMSDGLFAEQMRELLWALGYSRPQGVDRRSIHNLKSFPALKRVFNVSTRLSQGAARRKIDLTSEGLENEPSYELVTEDEKLKERWRVLGGAKNMIAEKTDPIWVQLSDFGWPWPPFSKDTGGCAFLRGVVSKATSKD